MQDKYFSLSPAIAPVQSRYDKKRVIEQRLEEARGGNIAKSVGGTFGLTAATCWYSRLQG
jgi:hypothetical protein